VKVLTLLRGDKVAYSVLRELAKAHGLSLGVPQRNGQGANHLVFLIATLTE